MALAVADHDTDAFERVRPRLTGIAHRVLGGAGEADDVLQDAWIRWQSTDRREVRDPVAFLATTTTRLAINVLQSARVRHEAPVRPEYADRIDAGADPSRETEQRESIDLAMRRLLERLSPSERAAYVLREAFEYPYRRIAEVLAVGEANARQLVTRARRALAAGPRQAVDPCELQQLVDAFVVAARGGGLAALERLLTGGMEPSHQRRLAA
ncbi:MAG: sigma-70 family RNA polymerase sigma factor [Solirubrobacteraceae bacterium]